MTENDLDEAARLALGLRADFDDLIAKGTRYDEDLTIRVRSDHLSVISRRAAELHEILKTLSPAAQAAANMLNASSVDSYLASNVREPERLPIQHIPIVEKVPD